VKTELSKCIACITRGERDRSQFDLFARTTETCRWGRGRLGRSQPSDNAAAFVAARRIPEGRASLSKNLKFLCGQRQSRVGRLGAAVARNDGQQSKYDNWQAHGESVVHW
jgi:hypothetical protein